MKTTRLKFSVKGALGIIFLGFLKGCAASVQRYNHKLPFLAYLCQNGLIFMLQL